MIKESWQSKSDMEKKFSESFSKLKHEMFIVQERAFQQLTK